MKHAAVGCLIGLGGWLAVALLLSALLQGQLQVPLVDTLGVSALAGLVGWAALNLLHAAWQAWRERAAIASGRAGRAPADGARVVLVGTLQALGAPLRVLGLALLLPCMLYVLGAAMRFKPWRLGALTIIYPRLAVVWRQLLAAPLELVAAAAIIHFALPEAGHPGFVYVLGAFLISFSAGLLSQVPGGIGVMEAVFLAVMPDVPVSAVLAALLVWRLLYLLLPLALSGPIILAFEHRQLTRRA